MAGVTGVPLRTGTIVCYSDSNTYGYAPTYLYEARYPDDVIWTNILAGRTLWKVLNYGLCGREIPHMESQFRHIRELVRSWAMEPPPVHLWIMLGTNDLLRHGTFRAEDAARRMEAFVCALQQEPCVQDGMVRIRVIAPPRLRQGEWTFEDSDRLLTESARLGGAYRGAVLRCSQDGRPRVDYTDASVWDIPVVYDGVHFSEEGHRLFAQHVLEEVPGLRR